jgi:hypothetical protein
MVSGQWSVVSWENCMRLGCVSLLLGLIVVDVTAPAAEVRLRSSAVCASSIVRLADVAEIRADEQQLAAALSDIPLCAAPAKGRERQFTQHDVRQLLALSGAEPTAVQVTGSETVTLLTEGSGFAATSVRPRTKPAAHRQVAFEVALPGEPEAIGRQPAVKPFSPTTASAEQAKPPKLVERGALCTVHARTGSIRVSTHGNKALQAGALGETIAIEMADTKERVLARIVGSQIAEVAVAGSADAQTSEPAVALLPVPAAGER